MQTVHSVINSHAKFGYSERVSPDNFKKQINVIRDERTTEWIRILLVGTTTQRRSTTSQPTCTNAAAAAEVWL